MPFGFVNTHGELHRLSDRFDCWDTPAEARRLAALVPGSVPVEVFLGGTWVPLDEPPANDERPVR